MTASLTVGRAIEKAETKRGLAIFFRRTVAHGRTVLVSNAKRQLHIAFCLICMIEIQTMSRAVEKVGENCVLAIFNGGRSLTAAKL